MRIQNPLLEEHYACLEVIHFVPKSWMCKKQTAVSHSSTESEIISLEGGLRVDGISCSRIVGSDCFSVWKHNSVHDRTGMFESRISAGGSEKLPFTQNLRISSWSYVMAGHAKKCVERYCELANKTTQQLYKVSTPCIDDHHFKEEETKLENCQIHALKLF